MIRDRRNTGDWFDQDRRGSLNDHAINMSIGPGKYDSPQQQSKVVSHNTGAVPFGVNQDTKKNLFGVIAGVPGPGDYEHSKITLTKPVAMKKANRMSLLGSGLLKPDKRFIESKSMKQMANSAAIYSLDTHQSNHYISTQETSQLTAR
jgi:hypothetical protein